MTFCDTLPDDVREEMEKAHLSSLLSLSEVGFMLCRHDDHIVRGYWCSGEECHISREQIQGCPPETEAIGFFHSHLTDEPKPSVGDLLYAYDTEIDYLCISGKEGDVFVVLCYDLRPVRDELGDISEMVSEIAEFSEKDYPEIADKLDELEQLEEKIIYDLENNVCKFKIEVM